MNKSHDLLLLLVNLSQLRSRNTIQTLFLESLSELFRPLTFEQVEREPDQAPSFPIATRHAAYGFLVPVNAPQLSEEDHTCLHNAAQMLAVLLNRIEFEEDLEHRRASVSQVAAERLAELERTVEQLRQSRNATLNLAEDQAWEIAERKRAEEQVKQNLKEKETLLRELYHRTKNNMQVIRAMLMLKAESHQNAEITAFVQEIEQKILAMALVHQKLYQSQDLSQVDLSEYLTELAYLLIQSYSVVSPRIALKLELDPVSVLIDTAMPCGLLVNELMSNALKHAFPDERAGEISIKLRRTSAGIIELSFADTGVGVPKDFDIRGQPTLGLQTIVGLAEQQLRGEIHYDGQDGLAYVFRFRDNLYTARV